MPYEFCYEGERHTVAVEKRDGGYRVTVDGRTHDVNASRLSPGLLSLILDGRSILVHTTRDDKGRIICIGGVSYHLDDPALEEVGSGGGEAHQAGDGTISTPMPGKIVAVHVKEGDTVKKQQPLLVVESMKMQNDIISDVQGVVKKIHFKPGDQASFGDPLVEIEVAEE